MLPGCCCCCCCCSCPAAASARLRCEGLWRWWLDRDFRPIDGFRAAGRSVVVGLGAVVSTPRLA
jgi:hypothetical protein